MHIGEYIHGASDVEIADWIAQQIAFDLECERGSVHIAVPGGSTPFPIFAELVKRDLDFARLVVWPTDDRIVPEDHAASNTGKIRRIFEPTGAKVVALEEGMDVPHFDMIWLGMGTDGHIASLFPNTDPDPADSLPVRRITPDPLPPEAPFDRITLTIPILSRSQRTMFVIRGEEKKAIFESADAEENDLPIARLLREVNALAAGEITCFT
ncbi:6-phosphogluconolactonase [Erythrobacter sp. Alg231-14]|uniref:6-phosphogluconolactonase n=1 Tax=Erythrobacter sp. Alg231-14 TaxID=1922225 RepID=UPI000D5616B3